MIPVVFINVPTDAYRIDIDTLEIYDKGGSKVEDQRANQVNLRTCDRGCTTQYRRRILFSSYYFPLPQFYRVMGGPALKDLIIAPPMRRSAHIYNTQSGWKISCVPGAVYRSKEHAQQCYNRLKRIHRREVTPIVILSLKIIHHICLFIYSDARYPEELLSGFVKAITALQKGAATDRTAQT